MVPHSSVWLVTSSRSSRRETGGVEMKTCVVFVVSPFLRSGTYSRAEAKFKEKLGEWDPMLELTLTSPYLIVDSAVQLPTPKTTNADECFPTYSKMEQPI